MKEEKACGCVVIEDGKVLLIQQIEGFWGFPKGHVENDESEIQTAIREVKEETNIDVEIVSTNRYISKYIINNEIDKTVVYFIAKPKTNELKMQESEILNLKWVNFEEAFDIITYDDNKEILNQILSDYK